jgi:hypothetical protein
MVVVAVGGMQADLTLASPFFAVTNETLPGTMEQRDARFAAALLAGRMV